MKEKTLEVLKKCKVSGNNVKLPEGTLDRDVYLEVSKALGLIGGKWKGGKVYAFEFKKDPTELLYEIANGEKINLKKEFQFFATPNDLAKEMVCLAEVFDGLTVLEPSAGQGAIINAIHSIIPNTTIDYCELMDVNRLMLDKISNTKLVSNDFLELPENNDFMYDRIIANPPFNKNQDIEHIQKMYKHLKPNGILVTLSSKHYIIASDKKSFYFKNWLNEIKASSKEIPSGTFKESGTSVATMLIVIKK